MSGACWLFPLQYSGFHLSILRQIVELENPGTSFSRLEKEIISIMNHDVKPFAQVSAKWRIGMGFPLHRSEIHRNSGVHGRDVVL
jgi:hypothetical protein